MRWAPALIRSDRSRGRKPTSDGHVTSVEVYDGNRELIIQFFGKRQEGSDERAGWRTAVERLPLHNQSNAA